MFSEVCGTDIRTDPETGPYKLAGPRPPGFETGATRRALRFMSGLIVYGQGEYNNDWERVGDEESFSGIFRIFRIFANFEPPQIAWDKNFRKSCEPRRARQRRQVQYSLGSLDDCRLLSLQVNTPHHTTATPVQISHTVYSRGLPASRPRQAHVDMRSVEKGSKLQV